MVALSDFCWCLEFNVCDDAKEWLFEIDPSGKLVLIGPVSVGDIEISEVVKPFIWLVVWFGQGAVCDVGSNFICTLFRRSSRPHAWKILVYMSIH